MTEIGLVLVAAAAFAGALTPRPLPLVLIALAAAAALFSRSVLIVAVAVALACAGLAERSWDGIEAPRPDAVAGTATVVTDPTRFGASTSAVIRIDGARYLATGWGGAGAALHRTGAGDRLAVAGSTSPYRARRARLAALHTGTRLALSEARPSAPAAPLWRLANGIRGHLMSGAESLSPARRALFTGIVYGDDRGQDDLLASDFRLAGLTHLLAVSGQNVAYVLTVARPLLQRLRLHHRWMATLLVLGVFAAVTRFEPSVLRATAMAGLAVTTRLVGRDASAGPLLAAAVTLLLLIDPLLAHTVAFRLSVAASAGIVWLRALVEPAWIRWSWLREAIGVTIAAQLAVAPILVATFGPVSLVSIPANVAAAPVAGATMAWGITGGMVAGFLPPEGAALVHRVTDGLLWLLEHIATTASLVPLAPVGLDWLGLCAAAGLLWGLRRTQRIVGGAAIALVVLLAMLLVPRATAGRHDVGRGSEVWIHGDHVVVVLNEEVDGRLLDDLRRLQVRRIDLLTGAASVRTQADRLRGRIGVRSTAALADRPLRWSMDDVILVIEPGDGGGRGRLGP